MQPWWVITDYLQLRQPDALLLYTITDLPCVLYVAHQPVPPARHPLYKTERGINVFRGYQYHWDSPTIVKQLPHPLPTHHNFQILSLPPAWSLYFYIFSYPGPFMREIQTPLLSDVFP